jgi:hypothetical protein
MWLGLMVGKAASNWVWPIGVREVDESKLADVFWQSGPILTSWMKRFIVRIGCSTALLAKS